MSIVITIGVTLFIATVLVLIFGRFLFRNSNGPYPCYRCAAVATTDYMGLRYCLMCRVVVVQMLPGVRHDPPYGFPGSSGYLEFPVEGGVTEAPKKKED